MIFLFMFSSNMSLGFRDNEDVSFAASRASRPLLMATFGSDLRPSGVLISILQ